MSGPVGDVLNHRVLVAGAHAQGLFMRVEHAPREGETVLGWDYDEPADGGKATNQAIAAARLGAPVALLTVVGDDPRGKRLLSCLKDERIDSRWVCVAPNRRTDVGFVMLPPSGIPVLTTASELSREIDAKFVRDAAAAFVAARVVVCQFESPDSGVAEAFRIARETGATTILNPAPFRQIDAELLALVDVLVMNEHEAAAWLGAEHLPEDLAAAIDARSSTCDVIVTLGSRGAVLVQRDRETFSVPAATVTATDTTGAGDALVGAVAASIQAGTPLRDAVQLGVRAATASVRRPGSFPSYPTADELTPPRAVPRRAK